MTQKKQRSIGILREPDDRGVAIISINVEKERALYALCEIRCDIGGRGFAMHRLGLGELYYVRVGPREDCSCECLGFLRHGYCRHIMGLLALIREGKWR